MFLKRAGWSLWRHKFRNILVLLVFSAILAVTLTSFLVYQGTSHQVEVTQKAVANAVSLSGRTVNGLTASYSLDLDYHAATRFVKAPHVERYNILMLSVPLESPTMYPCGLTDHEKELYSRYQELMTSYDPEFINMVNDWVNKTMTQSIYYSVHPNEENPGFRYNEVWNEELGVYTADYYNPLFPPGPDGSGVADEETVKKANEELLEAYNLMTTRIVDGEYVPKGYTVHAISDSEYYEAFASGGYNLVEGRHFKSEEENEKYIIISREMAEENGLKVGDTVELSFSLAIQQMATFYKNDPWELTVIGLFDPPENDLLGEIGYQTAARNFIFVPYGALEKYLYDLYNNETLLWAPSLNRATVYIDEPENVDAFIEDAYDRFRLVEVDQKTGAPQGTSIEEMLSEGVFDSGDPATVDAKFLDFITRTTSLAPYYYLSVDRGWYDMVAAPMESINRLSLFMGIGLLVGAFVALLLVCVFNVRSRKKEVGVLLSMGESRLKIFLQIFIEQALPLVLAACIGFASGVPLARAFGNSLLESRAADVNAAYEQDKREYLEAQLNGNTYSLENSITMRSAANVASPVEMQFVLDTCLAAGYFLLALCMLFVTVLIQMVFLLRLSPSKILTRRN